MISQKQVIRLFWEYRKNNLSQTRIMPGQLALYCHCLLCEYIVRKSTLGRLIRALAASFNFTLSSPFTLPSTFPLLRLPLHRSGSQWQSLNKQREIEIEWEREREREIDGEKGSGGVQCCGFLRAIIGCNWVWCRGNED